MDSILSVVSGGAGDILAYTGDIFTDLWVVIAVAIGIPLAFYVIRKVIGMVRVH
ncbi:MAG: hypothetical protein WC495_06750 [Patescibacteria group bacterium]|jgi:hypothetical protein